MLVSLEELDQTPVPAEAGRHTALDQLTQLIGRLRPFGRQVILAYLEGMDATEIGELTGLSATSAATIPCRSCDESAARINRHEVDLRRRRLA